jgi:hypothetical protein
MRLGYDYIAWLAALLWALRAMGLGYDYYSNGHSCHAFGS